MSESKNPLEAMLAQYEANNAPKYTKPAEANTYELTNYFNTFIEKGIKSATKTVRILPTADGSSPFVELWGHKAQIDGAWKTIPCLQHEKNEPCPFCEAHDILRATGKEAEKELAKKYKAKLFYVVKVIDRDNEADGVKFWRFAHDWRKEGILDKIQGVLLAIKKDVTNPETGRDLSININRNQLDKPTVSSVSHMDPSVLSEDTTKAAEWLADDRTWSKVYATKTYDFMKVVVRGFTPIWDKELKTFVGKEEGKSETETAEGEITMGVEDVKANITAATTTKSTETSEAEADTEELPF